MRVKQKGYLLIELALVIVLVALLSVQTMSWWRNKAQEQRLEALANWMLVVQKGVQQYLFTFHDSSTSRPSIIEPQEITLSTLIEAGFVSSAIQNTTEVKIKIFPEKNCITKEYCHLHSVIHTTKVLEHLVEPSQSEYWLNSWLGLTGERGLVVRARSSKQLAGIYQQFSNEVGVIGEVLPVNALAVYASIPLGQRQFLQFYEKQNPRFETDVDINGYVLLKKTASAYSPCAQAGQLTRADTSQALLMCDGSKWVNLFEQSEQPQPQAESSGQYELMVHQSLNYSQCSSAHPRLGQCTCLASEVAHLSTTRYSGSNPATSTYRYESYSCIPK